MMQSSSDTCESMVYLENQLECREWETSTVLFRQGLHFCCAAEIKYQTFERNRPFVNVEKVLDL